MNWDDLRFVLEVARSGSLVAASKALRVSHTTVARRLQALEQAQGAPLFERRGNAYQPTELARGLVELASEMDERIAALERRLQAHKSAPRVEGEVHITTVAAMADRLGPQLVAFRERYPEVRLRLSVSNDMVNLARGEADVAIRITREPPERLVGRKLTDVRFAVFGAAHALPEPVGDLHALPWVCLDASRADTPQGQWEAEHVDDARVVLRTNSRGLFLDAVKRGLGIGVLPVGLGRDDTLRALSETLEELSLPVWILTHADLRKTPRIRAVMDFFGDTIDGARDRL